MLQWLSEKLFPGDGDGNTHPTDVTPQIGAAALMIEAVHRDGVYTQVEKDLATHALMKLFRLGNAEATELRKQAEKAQSEASYMMRFAVAAGKLDADCKEHLITTLWSLIDSDDRDTIPENFLVRSVIDVMGISHERARALRPAKPKEVN